MFINILIFEKNQDPYLDIFEAECITWTCRSSVFLHKKTLQHILQGFGLQREISLGQDCLWNISLAMDKKYEMCNLIHTVSDNDYGPPANG